MKKKQGSYGATSLIKTNTVGNFVPTYLARMNLRWFLNSNDGFLSNKFGPLNIFLARQIYSASIAH